MKPIRLAFAALVFLIAFSSAAHACQCAYTVPGFLTSTSVILPANAIGVPWAGSAMDSSRNQSAPDSSHFRVEIEEKATWRTIPAVVVPVPADLSGVARQHGDPPVVVVGPRGGVRARRRYRVSSIIVSQRSVVVAVVSQRKFLAADGKASVKVGPIARGNASALTLAGSCTTHFDAATSSIRLALSSELLLEPWGDALLYVVRDQNGQVWRPDSSLCDRTPPGRNALGLGHERLYQYCGPMRAREGVERWGDNGPPQQQLPPGPLTFEFVAWLPGTKEKVAASASVSLDCKGPGR